MTYLDAVAYAIGREVADPNPTPDDLNLYRVYAVLCLAKGEATTDEDVHNAWSAWMLDLAPEHRSIVPFDMLAPETRAMDTPYTNAIRTVARRRAEGVLDGTPAS